MAFIHDDTYTCLLYALIKTKLIGVPPVRSLYFLTSLWMIFAIVCSWMLLVPS